VPNSPSLSTRPIAQPSTPHSTPSATTTVRAPSPGQHCSVGTPDWRCPASVLVVLPSRRMSRDTNTGTLQAFYRTCPSRKARPPRATGASAARRPQGTYQAKSRWWASGRAALIRTTAVRFRHGIEFGGSEGADVHASHSPPGDRPSASGRPAARDDAGAARAHRAARPRTGRTDGIDAACAAAAPASGAEGGCRARFGTHGARLASARSSLGQHGRGLPGHAARVLAPARRRAHFAWAQAAGAASALLWQLPLLRPPARGNHRPAARRPAQGGGPFRTVTCSRS
jgi:hypothetical protein